MGVVGAAPERCLCTRPCTAGYGVSMTSYTMTDARANLAGLLDGVEKTHDEVEITRNGRVAGVLINPDELDSLRETLEVMSDPVLMAAIREGQREIEDGNYIHGDEAKTWAEKMMARTRGK
jgi:antitoxin YefM